MRELNSFLLLCCILFSSAMAQPAFICSSFCSASSCIGYTPNDCNNVCRTNWVGGGGSCSVNTLTNRELLECSDDSGGSFAVTPYATTSTTCSSITTMSFYGPYLASQSINVTLAGGTAIPHYAMEVIYNIILVDTNSGGNSWNVGGSPGRFTTKLVDTGQSFTTSMTATTTTSNNYCGSNSRMDNSIIIFLTFNPHTALNSQIQFTISNNNPNGNAVWVMKQFVVVALMCRIECLTCFNGSVSGCLSCDPNQGMTLSNTTCGLTCPTGYGYTNDPTLCIWCNLRCTQCFQLANNCTACTATGTWTSFLYNDGVTFPTCVANCTLGYFKNTTTQTCDLCDANCTGCTLSPTHCTSCQPSFGWNAYTCLSTCNPGFFLSCNGVSCAANYTNCTACSPLCTACTVNSTFCTVCTLTGANKAYLSGSTCVANCPNNFFNSLVGGANVCSPCDPSCKVCSANPTPCTACNTGYFLYNSVCGLTCPPDYIKYSPTNACEICSLFCVGVSINMYFPAAMKSTLYVDMTFSSPVDFATFNYQNFQTLSIDSSMYTMSMFSVVYSVISNTTYRITVAPLGYIFLYNATISVTTGPQPTPIDQAIDTTPFRVSNYGLAASTVWFVVDAPSMSALETAIINGISSLNDQVSMITTLPFVQEIKKSGIFALIFSGAQVTSISLLINSVPSQNLYEGARFWAIYVYFDSPPWEQDGSNDELVVAEKTSTVVANARLLPSVTRSRQLFDLTTVMWRFRRTGQTSFFIFDVYIPLFLIFVCWLMILIAHKCFKDSKAMKKHAPRFFTCMHKIHELSIFYISLATILEWMYFDAESWERWLSFGLCLLTNFYFVGYELYIYWDMMQYPLAQIGNDKYEFYLQRYSFFLKKIRYVEYDFQQSWSPKQWFRPYNYHILSYYKKVLMMVAMPIFYDTQHSQIIVLIIIQILEIIRFGVIRPYYSKWRNVVRLCLQFLLLIFFITVAAQTYIILDIMKNDTATLSTSIETYYTVGWLGFVIVFLFNLGFVVLFIIDAVVGCRMTNRELMDEARRLYFFEKLTEFEKLHDEVPLKLMNQWVKQGNLNQRNTAQLPQINLRVELFKIRRIGRSYEVEMKKIIELFMNAEFNFQKENNTDVVKKCNKKIILTRELSPRIYNLVEEIFKVYDKKNLGSITIKTFMNLNQQEYDHGDRVPLKPENMFQKIDIQDLNGQIESKQLDRLLPGFPLSQADVIDL